MKLTILGLFLSFAISAFSNDFSFNKVYEPEAASIISFTEYDGSIYAASNLKIFKIDDINSEWETLYEVETNDNFSEIDIQFVFTIRNEFFEFLCYSNSNSEVFYWDNGFFEVDLPAQFANLEIERIKETKSGRTLVLAEDENFNTILLDLVIDGLDVALIPVSNQTRIDSFSEDENGDLWVIGNEIEIFSDESFSTIDFNKFIFSDIEVMNRKIYYAEEFEIYYWDYDKSEEVTLQLPDLGGHYFSTPNLGFEEISETELLFYSGGSEGDKGFLIKINTVTDETELILERFGSLNTVIFDEGSGNYLFGTEKSVLFSDPSFESFSENSKGLSGFVSFLTYYSENYFFGYSFDGGVYAYNLTDDSEFNMYSDSELGFRLFLGEANNNMIALESGLSFSDDGGQTWEESNLLFDVEGGIIFNLEYKNDELYYLVENRIYISLDFGKTWNQEAELNLGADVYPISFSIYNDGYLISTDQGLYSYNSSLELVALGGEFVFDSKVVNFMGDDYIVAVFYEDDIAKVYRKNLTTEEVVVIETDGSGFDDIGLFFTIQDNGNVILADMVNFTNSILYMNEEEAQEISIEGDFIVSFRENFKGEHIGSSIRGNIYQLETVLSVNGNYELKINQVYPNPARDIIKLKDIQNNTLVEITDNLGNTFETRYNSGIDISRVGTGMYFVKYQNTNGEFVTSKFIKE